MKSVGWPADQGEKTVNSESKSHYPPLLFIDELRWHHKGQILSSPHFKRMKLYSHLLMFLFLLKAVHVYSRRSNLHCSIFDIWMSYLHLLKSNFAFQHLYNGMPWNLYLAYQLGWILKSVSMIKTNKIYSFC